MDQRSLLSWFLVEECYFFVFQFAAMSKDDMFFLAWDVVAFFQLLQLRSSMEVETAPSEVDPSSMEVERGDRDLEGSLIFCEYGLLFIFSYRGDPSPIEVEVGSMLQTSWCCVKSDDLQCLVLFYKMVKGCYRNVVGLQYSVVGLIVA